MGFLWLTISCKTYSLSLLDQTISVFEIKNKIIKIKTNKVYHR